MWGQLKKSNVCVCVSVTEVVGGWALNRSLGTHWETGPLVKSHQTGREKKPCWGFYLLKQTEGNHASLLHIHPIYLWARCSRNVSFPSRDSGEEGAPLTMTTFKMSHTCVHRKDNTAAICITDCHPDADISLRSLSVSGMWGILAWPFDCKKKKKRRAPFLKEQRGLLGVGSDGQGPFSLMLSIPPTSPPRLTMSEDSVKSRGAAPMALLLWDLPSIWLIRRPLCAAEMKKRHRINCNGGKKRKC